MGIGLQTRSSALCRSAPDITQLIEEDRVERLRMLTAASVFLFICTGTAFAQRPVGRLLEKAARGSLKRGQIPVMNGSTISAKPAPFFSSGILASALAATDAADERAAAADAGPANDLAFADLGVSPGTLGCGDRQNKGNVRVNQDCGFRRQAETSIVFNPDRPNNLLGGMNDSRVGFNQCGIAFSTDNGRHWGDLLPPFRQKQNNPAGQEPTPSDPNRHTIQGGPGTLHTYDAASDPAVAFDSKGRAFFSCVAFDVFASNAAMVFVTQSPIGAAGSFFLNIRSLSRNFVVAEDNAAEVFHD